MPLGSDLPSSAHVSDGLDDTYGLLIVIGLLIAKVVETAGNVTDTKVTISYISLII